MITWKHIVLVITGIIVVLGLVVTTWIILPYVGGVQALPPEPGLGHDTEGLIPPPLEDDMEYPEKGAE